MAIIETGNDPVVRIAGRSGVSVGFIAAASTFTATVASDGGSGKTILTSLGAHGLTSAVAVGKHLPITGGTNWTAGFYPITAIDLDTTGVAVTITYTYSASLGSPTIALVNTDVVFATVSIPALRADSYIEVEGTWSYPSNGNTKNPTVKWGGSIIYQTSVSASLCSRPASILAQNRGSTGSQVCGLSTGNIAQTSTDSGVPATKSINTSVATQLTIGGKVTTANDYLYIERYIAKYVL